VALLTSMNFKSARARGCEPVSGRQKMRASA
jgi:hypothetical protein